MASAVQDQAVTEHTVEIHGHEVAFRSAGDLDAVRDGGAGAPPVIVLVHGMAGSSATWTDVMPRLADDFVVIAPDLLGHGRSSKPRHDYSLGAHANLVRDLLARLGVDHATLVGHSLGGGVVMQFAYQHPQRCERLVLVSSGGLGPDVSWILRVFALPGFELLMPVLFPSFVRDVGNAISQRLRGLGLRAPGIEQEWASYVSLTNPENREAFVKTLRSVIDMGGQSVSAHDRLYLAEALPTLILWGGQDRIIPVDHAHAAQQSLPTSRLEIFEHAGHFLHNEEPERFAEVLRAFLESTEPVHLDEREWAAVLAGPSAIP